ERRVVEFRACKNTDVIKSSCNQDLAVGQQGRRVNKAGGVEAASGCPGPECWIVQFRARGRLAAAITSAGHQHLAVEQLRRRGQLACGVEAARCTPHPADSVV